MELYGSVFVAIISIATVVLWIAVRNQQAVERGRGAVPPEPRVSPPIWLRLALAAAYGAFGWQWMAAVEDGRPFPVFAFLFGIAGCWLTIFAAVWLTRGWKAARGIRWLD